MRTITARLTVAAVVSAPFAASLLVAPDSPCSKYCGNVQSSTARDELACDTGTLKNTPVGVVWEQCIECQLTSTYVSGNRSDLQALLYNLRVSMAYCLFDSKDNNPCKTTTACGPLEDAIKYQNLTTSVGAYDYCTNWQGFFVPKCSPCLTVLDDRGQYLNNYLMILEAACEQKPAPGSTVSVEGDPFSTDTVEIVPPHPTYATVPTPDYGPVSLGARVGIAFGGLAFILAVAGFCIVCIGKRRRRAFLRELERRHGAQGWPHPKFRYGSDRDGGAGSSDMFETPVSQRPLRGWENESPVSALPERTFPRYFSPYTSQYSSPVTVPEGGGPSTTNWPTLAPQQQFNQIVQGQSPVHGSPPPAFSQWPTAAQEKLLMQMHAHHEKRQNEIAIGVALGGDDASSRSKASNLNPNGYPIESKGKERDEAYEMHEVESPYTNGGNGDVARQHYDYRMPAEPQAPVLHHPGYGRDHGSRPESGDLDAAAAG
ncbi:hypothetical protein VTK56DRAFT_7143 [Thermocarpiscus australiensis]